MRAHTLLTHSASTTCPMEAIARMQATLDDHKHDMPEGVYLKMCNDIKALHVALATSYPETGSLR